MGYIKYFKNIFFLVEPRKGNKLQEISGSYNLFSSEKTTMYFENGNFISSAFLRVTCFLALL